MATVKTITVSYERKISDGNYGTESASAFVVAELGEGETLSKEQAFEAADLARAVVYGILLSSGNRTVIQTAATEHAHHAK